MHLGGSSPITGLYSCYRGNAVFFSQSRWNQAEVTHLLVLVDIKQAQPCSPNRFSGFLGPVLAFIRSGAGNVEIWCLKA